MPVNAAPSRVWAPVRPRVVSTQNTLTNGVTAVQSHRRWVPARHPVSSALTTACCWTNTSGLRHRRRHGRTDLLFHGRHTAHTQLQMDQRVEQFGHIPLADAQSRTARDATVAWVRGPKFPRGICVGQGAAVAVPHVPQVNVCRRYSDIWR